MEKSAREKDRKGVSELDPELASLNKKYVVSHLYKTAGEKFEQLGVAIFLNFSNTSKEHTKPSKSCEEELINRQELKMNPEAPDANLQPVPSTSSSAESRPAVEKPKISGGILVSARQRGNPILKFVRSVPWEFTDSIVPDYVIGQNSCALYLSLKYHTLNPNYIHERLNQLGTKAYVLRVLLVQVDVQDPHHSLKQLMRICILAELTLMLAWSHEEAGKILEVYKTFENKPPDMIMEKSNPDGHSKLIDTLTSVKSVNKTDAATLLSTFGSLEKIAHATIEELTLCPGFGPQKAQRLSKVLNMPFKKAPI